jgi:hypothetical protein
LSKITKIHNQSFDHFITFHFPPKYQVIAYV